MARFYGTVQGHRGQASRLGHNIMRTTTRGWNIGASCELSPFKPDPEIDRLSIIIDGGSSRTERFYGGCGVQLVGETAIITPDEDFIRNISPLTLMARITSAFGNNDAHWAHLSELVARNPVARKHMKAALFIEGGLSE